jgi:nitroreductase
MNETIKTIYNLHTTHGNFTAQPVEEELIKTIVDACIRGANASNRQSYSIIVVKGEDRVKKVLSCGLKSPIALIFCADFNRIYDIGEYLGYPSSYDDLFNYLTAHTDAVIAAQTAVITATSLGLGHLYTNSIHNAYRKNINELYTDLKLPEKHFFPVTAVMLGYEDQAPDYKTGRLSDTGIVHYESYEFLTKEQKEEIIQTVNNPENHFGGKGNCDTYLEYFYTKWAPPLPQEKIKKTDELISGKLAPFLSMID